MIKKGLLFLFVILLSSCTIANRENVEGISHFSLNASPEITEPWTYSVYLPPNYKKEDNLPIVYLLHGLGGNYMTWNNRRGTCFQETVDNLINSKQIPPVIIVMPDSLMGGVSFWVDYRFPKEGTSQKISTAFASKLIPHVEAKFGTRARTSEERTIAGISMGGFGAMHYAFKYTEMFNSAIIMAPATIPISLAFAVSLLPGGMPPGATEANGIPTFIALYKNYHKDPLDGTVDFPFYKSQYYNTFQKQFRAATNNIDFYFVTGADDDIFNVAGMPLSAVTFQENDVKQLQKHQKNPFTKREITIKADIVPGVSHYTFKAEVPFFERGLKYIFRAYREGKK